MRLLHEVIINAAEMGSTFDTFEVLDESSRIKRQRIVYGVQFLLEIGCSDLSNNLVEKANFTPTRSWINSVLEDLEAHIRPRRFVDSKRLVRLSYSVVNNFYTTFGSIIQETERALIFTVD